MISVFKRKEENMKKNKSVLGLCVLASVFMGCTTSKPIIQEREEIKTNDKGQTVTNMAQRVVYEEEYSMLGRVRNATVGSVKGIWNGVSKTCTSTNGTESASVWEKALDFPIRLVKDVASETTQETKAGYNRKLADDKAVYEAILLERKQKSL
jgi:hypothetical protein